MVLLKTASKGCHGWRRKLTKGVGQDWIYFDVEKQYGGEEDAQGRLATWSKKNIVAL